MAYLVKGYSTTWNIMLSGSGVWRTIYFYGLNNMLYVLVPWCIVCAVLGHPIHSHVLGITQSLVLFKS